MSHPQSQMPIPMRRKRQKRFLISRRGYHYHLEIRLISHPLAAHKAPRQLYLLACLLVYLPGILFHHHLAHRRMIYCTISPQTISSPKAHHPLTP